MTEPQVTDEYDEAEEDPELLELRRTRIAAEHLSDEVVDLAQRISLTRTMIGIIAFLLVFVSLASGYGYWYIQNREAKEREELMVERAIIENTFRTGCENSVETRLANRNELISLMTYLGTRSGLSQDEIQRIIDERVAVFNQINPPRDCEAEAQARAEKRGDGGLS